MTGAEAMQKLRKFIVNRARHAKDRDAAFEALFAIVEENVSLRADCVTLAKLAAETPQYFSPVAVWEAQALRDRYLAAGSGEIRRAS